MPGIGSSLGVPRHADTILAACLVAGVLVGEGAAGSLIRHWTVPVMALGCGAALVLRQRQAAASAALCAAAVLVPVVFGQRSVLNGPIDILLCVPFLISYSLGTRDHLVTGIAGAALLSAGLQAGDRVFNPFFVMITFGPWLAGRIIRSRHHLILQLAARNRELEAERERFAQESVRHERARIARELHDAVGHCVSVIVVQASAGQRLADGDPASVNEVFASIGEAAEGARAEIGRLVDLLTTEPADQVAPNLAMVDELVRRAGRAGLHVSCRRIGDCRPLRSATANAVYRVVQKSLTSALKHAPGSPVHITLRETDAGLEVQVINAAARHGPSGLEKSGSGRGLTGMRERVAECGGTLTPASTPTGDWRVAALLPIDAPTGFRSAGLIPAGERAGDAREDAGGGPGVLPIE
jgi:signal transduction histidine kinase